jgi:hypothetical protein
MLQDYSRPLWLRTRKIFTENSLKMVDKFCKNLYCAYNQNTGLSSENMKRTNPKSSLSPRQTEYIRKNFRLFSDARIAKALSVEKKHVKGHLADNGLLRTDEEERQIRQKVENPPEYLADSQPCEVFHRKTDNPFGFGFLYPFRGLPENSRPYDNCGR